MGWLQVPALETAPMVAAATDAAAWEIAVWLP
jgi:hypothetical protein